MRPSPSLALCGLVEGAAAEGVVVVIAHVQRATRVDADPIPLRGGLGVQRCDVRGAGCCGAGCARRRRGCQSCSVLRGRWGGARTCDMAFKNEISLKRDRAGFTGPPQQRSKRKQGASLARRVLGAGRHGLCAVIITARLRSLRSEPGHQAKHQATKPLFRKTSHNQLSKKSCIEPLGERAKVEVQAARRQNCCCCC